MKTSLLNPITLLLLFLCNPASAEIYTWVDDNGKTHFSDSPHEEKPVETVELEPAIKIGTVKPQSAEHLFEKDYAKSKQKEKQRADLAEKRRKKKEELRKACDRAREDLIKAKVRRAGASSSSSKRYYNEQIELAKDREGEACKLSHFR